MSAQDVGKVSTRRRRDRSPRGAAGETRVAAFT